MTRDFVYSNIQGIHKRIVLFQKLRRNLFLTLHGHNVHRQQWQLSKFLLRYQQFASHAYCGAAGPISKMTPAGFEPATLQQWLYERGSVLRYTSVVCLFYVILKYIYDRRVH